MEKPNGYDEWLQSYTTDGVVDERAILVRYASDTFDFLQAFNNRGRMGIVVDTHSYVLHYLETTKDKDKPNV